MSGCYFIAGASNDMEFTITGLDGTITSLNEVSSQLRTNIVRRALLRAAEPLEKEMKARAPVRKAGPFGKGPPLVSEALRQSIGSVARSYKHGTQHIVVIGPRRKMYKIAGGASTASGADEIAIPTRYAHLVEFGHRITNLGAPVYVPPRHFITDSWAAKGGMQAFENFKNALIDEMNKTMKRIYK